MSAVYRLIKVEQNKPETEVILSVSDYETLLCSIQEYDNYLKDSEPFVEDSEDHEEWDILCKDFDSLERKLLKFNGII
jgi:hypothetical protein